jgi:hypothetical protein
MCHTNFIFIPLLLFDRGNDSVLSVYEQNVTAGKGD